MTVLYLNYILFINYTYYSSVSTVKFEQVNADWECLTLTYYISSQL